MKTEGGAKLIHNYHKHNNIESGKTISPTQYSQHILLTGYTACTVACTWYPSVTFTKHMPGP